MVSKSRAGRALRQAREQKEAALAADKMAKQRAKKSGWGEHADSAAHSHSSHSNDSSSSSSSSSSRAQDAGSSSSAGSWTGKTPVSLLHEQCAKNQAGRPQIRPINLRPAQVSAMRNAAGVDVAVPTSGSELSGDNDQGNDKAERVDADDDAGADDDGGVQPVVFMVVLPETRNGRQRMTFRLPFPLSPSAAAVDNNKNTRDVVDFAEYYFPKDEGHARHIAATCALFGLHSDLPLYRLLDVPYRELWRKLEVRQKIVDSLEQERGAADAARSARQENLRIKRGEFTEAEVAKLDAVYMTDAARALVARVLEQERRLLRPGHVGGEIGADGESWEMPSAVLDAHKKLSGTFGFTPEQARHALFHVCGSETSAAGVTTADAQQAAARPPPRVQARIYAERALDFLVSHLPESELPAQFDPSHHQVKLVSAAEQRDKAAAAATAVSEAALAHAAAIAAADAADPMRSKFDSPAFGRVVTWLRAFGFADREEIENACRRDQSGDLGEALTQVSEADLTPSPNGNSKLLVSIDGALATACWMALRLLTRPLESSAPLSSASQRAARFDAPSALTDELEMINAIYGADLASSMLDQSQERSSRIDTYPHAVISIKNVPMSAHKEGKTSAVVVVVHFIFWQEMIQQYPMSRPAVVLCLHKNDDGAEADLSWLRDVQSAIDNYVFAELVPAGEPCIFATVSELQSLDCKRLSKSAQHSSISRIAGAAGTPFAAENELAEDPLTGVVAASHDSSTETDSKRPPQKAGKRRDARSPHGRLLTPAAALEVQHKLWAQQKFAEEHNAPTNPLWHIRRALPAHSKKAELVQQLANHDVVIVTGETGSGKSTQVPQFILEAAITNNRGADVQILCTQPRRIAAIGLANRVSQERCDVVWEGGKPSQSYVGRPGSTVGYHIRGEVKRDRLTTRILYCTVGILLRQLTARASGSETQSNPLDGITHVVVDEVHERSVDIDFLMLLLKGALLNLRHARSLPAPQKRSSRLKVILMSATAETEGLQRYFRSCNDGDAEPPIIHIEGRTFPVKNVFLDDLERDRDARDLISKQCLGYSFSHDSELFQSEQTSEQRSSKKQNNKKAKRDDEFKIDYNLIVATVLHILSLERKKRNHDVSKPAILIFLPGIADISTTMSRLNGVNAWVVAAHSSLSNAEQQKIFQAPPKNFDAKVVLATNIAETSITIPDVTHVIDSGRANQLSYDPLRHISILQEQWISQASARQRSGRAGRVSSGVCWRLYTQDQFHGRGLQRGFPTHDRPEIQRSPLHQLLLQVSVLKPMLVSRNSVLFPTNKQRAVTLADILQQCISPPPGEAVVAATDALIDVNAITQKDEELTPLGHHLAQLPVDCHIGKLLLFSAILCCVDPVTTIAASLGYRSPFTAPLDQRDEAQRLRLAAFSGPSNISQVVGGSEAVVSGPSSKSDHMAVVYAYNQWRDDRISGRTEHRKQQWCRDNFISHRTMKMLQDLKQQYCDLLVDLGFVSHADGRDATAPSGGSADINRYSRHEHVVKAALAAGLYPNVLRIAAGAESFTATAYGAVQKDKHAKELKLIGRPKGGSTKGDRAFVHPGSINFQVARFESNWLCYYEMVQTSRVFVRDTTCIYPLALLLFGGHSTAVVASTDCGKDAAVLRREAMDMIHVDHVRGIVSVDGWMHFKAPARIGVLIRELRYALDELLVAKIRDPMLDMTRRPLVHCIAQLVATDGNVLTGEVLL